VQAVRLKLISTATELVVKFAKHYEHFTWAVGDRTGATDTLVHVHAGMALLLLARVVTGRSLATPVPFLVVCACELVNEVLDRISSGSWNWPDTSMDVVNTLFWPLVLMVGLRTRRAHDAKRGA
jgi:hypothetical protein